MHQHGAATLTGATVAVLLLALVGHAVLWVGTVNRAHALGIPRKVVTVLNVVCLAAVTTIPLWFVWWLLRGGQVIPHSLRPGAGLGLAHAYLLVCVGILLAHLPAWIRLRRSAGPRTAVVQHHVRSIDIAARLGRWPTAGLKARVLARVPGNQMFHLDVDQEQVQIERLAAELTGISILHLSDFHISGRVEPAYFQEVVRIANDLQPDLLAVTGDLCDFAGGIDWIADIFGRLEAPLGKFFILGNHDLRTRDVPRLRRAMSTAGFVDVATGPITLQLRGQPVYVAGNERPWFRTPEPCVSQEADADERTSRGLPLKILLSHSPDQFAWARERGFDLMLAGHTHGGQLCLPWVGAVVCPSRYGIRYAGGTFYEPPTVLHVSRGISSLLPLRLSCPCEMTKLILQPPIS